MRANRALGKFTQSVAKSGKFATVVSFRENVMFLADHRPALMMYICLLSRVIALGSFGKALFEGNSVRGM